MTIVKTMSYFRHAGFLPPTNHRRAGSDFNFLCVLAKGARQGTLLSYSARPRNHRSPRKQTEHSIMSTDDEAMPGLVSDNGSGSSSDSYDGTGGARGRGYPEGSEDSDGGMPPTLVSEGSSSSEESDGDGDEMPSLVSNHSNSSSDDSDGDDGDDEDEEAPPPLVSDGSSSSSDDDNETPGGLRSGFMNNANARRSEPRETPARRAPRSARAASGAATASPPRERPEYIRQRISAPDAFNRMPFKAQTRIKIDGLDNQRELNHATGLIIK